MNYKPAFLGTPEQQDNYLLQQMERDDYQHDLFSELLITYSKSVIGTKAHSDYCEYLELKADNEENVYSDECSYNDNI